MVLPSPASCSQSIPPGIGRACRLEAVCPSGADSIRSLWRWRSLPKEQMPFLLQVASYDRQGMLHSLTHALWESDTTVGG